MRSRVFRVLAGLLAVGFVWSLSTADLSAWSFRRVVGSWAIGLVFGVFALFGTEPAERLLALVFGGDYPKQPPTEQRPEDDKHA